MLIFQYSGFHLQMSINSRCITGTLFSLLVPLSALSAEKTEVVCRVDKTKILRGEVERELIRSLANQKFSADAQEILMAHALDVIISRRLVLRYLKRTKRGASHQDVDYRMEQIQRHLSQRAKTVEKFLHETGQSYEELRFRVVWELSWSKYLKSELDEAAIERYFEKHRHDFDGTKIRVAQILLRPQKEATEPMFSELTNRAAQIAAKVKSRKLTFAEAARSHSMAPSADQGGELGLISRHVPMPEAFSRAAFALRPHEISSPIRTKFGIHLIQCREIQPGGKFLDEVHDQVAQAAKRYLFDWIVEREKPRAKIVFTGTISHVDLKSGEVVISPGTHHPSSDRQLFK